jgi:hypothetical protein
MTTTRGFVDRIEVRRAGLVVVRLVNETGRTDYVIADLDGDPERFNERLSKVALARDAMNRAEPVEVEWDDGKAGREINRIARISRDRLEPPAGLEMLGGLVIRVTLQARNALEGEGETHDDAHVDVLGETGEHHVLRLDMQTPERAVAAGLLDMIRDAYAAGEFTQFLVTSDVERAEQEIVAVLTGRGAVRGEDPGRTVGGFVESLGVILPAGVDALGGALAIARLTTAPDLAGPGGEVDLAPFEPEQLDLFVARGSVPYALLEAGLRENTRVRVRFRERPRPGPDTHGIEQPSGAGLLLGAELEAPLASASRPVWLHIDRTMLDRGPDGYDTGCTPGLPASSLRPSSLRDLRIPYRAEWKGRGCFNHGVYRFELTAPDGSTIEVGGDPLCLYASGQDGVRVAYACLEGDRSVTVVVSDYVCDTEFGLDVYRIR